MLLFALQNIYLNSPQIYITRQLSIFSILTWTRQLTFLPRQELHLQRHIVQVTANEEPENLFGLWDNQGSSTDISQMYNIRNCPYAFMAHSLNAVLKSSGYDQVSELKSRHFPEQSIYVFHLFLIINSLSAH